MRASIIIKEGTAHFHWTLYSSYCIFRLNVVDIDGYSNLMFKTVLTSFPIGHYLNFEYPTCPSRI